MIRWKGPVIQSIVLPSEIMNPRDRADKPAIGHVSEG